MKRILFALQLLICGLPIFSRAQQKPLEAKIVTKKTEYFDKDREKLPSAENACYRVETTYFDDASGTVQEFYPSGSVKEISPYTNLESLLRHGTTTTWYEDGKLQSKEDYFKGKPHGERLSYYPDGTLRRHDQFVKGKRTKGECFGPDGKPVAYFEYVQMPIYPGGLNAMMQYIARNLRYPSEALKTQTQGKVFVAFVVGEDGSMRNVRVTKSLGEVFDSEAMRVINGLKQFSPGLLDGVPTPISFTVPIEFAIR